MCFLVTFTESTRQKGVWAIKYNFIALFR